MKIYAISVVKNEEDIIVYNLQKASEWSDKIFVLDNGSSDATWECVVKLSKTNKKVIPWKKDTKPFHEGLRGEVYNEFKNISRKGDWWCFRLDADEFYIDQPKVFLSQVPSKYHYVCKDSIEYKITYEDLTEVHFTGNIPEELNYIKYYSPFTWTEARFFRYRESLFWNSELPFPKHMGIVYPKKILCKHYQYRSPQQIQQRLDTRGKAINEGFDGWKHASQIAWQEKISDRKDLIKDNGSNNFKFQGCSNSHLHKPHIYYAKRILHGLKILP